MKMLPLCAITLLIFLLLLRCGEGKKEKSINYVDNKENTSPSQPHTTSDFTAPDFNDPTLKQYYTSYTDYLKKVVAAIRSNDEAGTMKLFREEGKQWDNRNEMEDKARSSPEEEQKFTTWLMKSLPYNKEIVVG